LVATVLFRTQISSKHNQKKAVLIS